MVMVTTGSGKNKGSKNGLFLHLPRLTLITMGWVEDSYIPLCLNSSSQKCCCATFHADSSEGV